MGRGHRETRGGGQCVPGVPPDPCLPTSPPCPGTLRYKRTLRHTVVHRSPTTHTHDRPRAQRHAGPGRHGLPHVRRSPPRLSRTLSVLSRPHTRGNVFPPGSVFALTMHSLKCIACTLLHTSEYVYDTDPVSVTRRTRSRRVWEKTLPESMCLRGPKSGLRVRIRVSR